MSSAEREALEGMVRQFAYWSDGEGGYSTGGLSALEDAFDVLGWDDPQPAPEVRCDERGCMKQATSGWPTRPGGTGLNGGYRRTCYDHSNYKNPPPSSSEASDGGVNGPQIPGSPFWRWPKGTMARQSAELNVRTRQLWRAILKESRLLRWLTQQQRGER